MAPMIATMNVPMIARGATTDTAAVATIAATRMTHVTISARVAAVVQAAAPEMMATEVMAAEAVEIQEVPNVKKIHSYAKIAHH